MEDQIISLLKTIIPGLVVAIVTSLITVRLSIRRFYEEKWWEKKYDAYTGILQSLHHFKKYALKHFDSYVSHKKISEDAKKELESDWKKHSKEFEMLHDMALFQLSEEANRILDEYREAKNEAKKCEDIFEWIDKDADAAISCLKKLSLEAKNDLKIK